MNIYPSLLTSNITTFQEQLENVKKISEISVVQVDVLDGFFADNITVSPVDVAACDFGDLKIDFHLMVDDSYDFLYEIDSNADFLPVRSVVTQVERLHQPVYFLKEVKDRGWLAGLSLNRGTPLEALEDEWWEYLDIVQVMAVDAGFQGQVFHPEVLDLVASLKKKLVALELDIEIIVDGGVSLDTIVDVSKSGADAVAVGSALWKAHDVSEAAISLMKESIE